MQTQKMSLAYIKGKLSRAEMKNLMAGATTVSCDGHVGTWTYTGPVKCSTIFRDIGLYCRSNSGTIDSGYCTDGPTR